MSPIISEVLIVKFDPKKFEPTSSEFAKLRDVAAKYGAKEQYYGLCTEEADTLLWVLQWPAKDPSYPEEFKGAKSFEPLQKQIELISAAGTPKSWLMPFDNAELVRPALTAPLCQLCYLHIKDNAPMDILAPSLHKTFTDCYFAKGFTGGYWSPALNDPKMNYYYLGWETRELHDDFAKTELFDEEIDKIMPHADLGGTNYAKMTKYTADLA